MNYYKKVREGLERNSSVSIRELGLPEDLYKQLRKLIVSDDDLNNKYNDNSFTEQDWARFEKVCLAYNSPLNEELA